MRLRTEIDWDTLDELKVSQINDPRFNLLSKAFVSGEGDTTGNADAFIIGEAPGAQEQVRERPFIGPSGQVLRQLMATANLWATDPEDAYTKANGPTHVLANCWLTNVVKFRPPGNRNPTEAEIVAARPYLFREWLAVGAPRLIIPVGKIALRAVTGKWLSILKVAGHCREIEARDGEVIYVWPMIHPRFGLSNPTAQAIIEADWLRLRDWRANN